MGPEQNAVITGASSDIGSAIATAIASTGASVCLVGRNAERLESDCQKAARNCPHGDGLTIRFDSIDSAVEELVRRLKHEFEASMCWCIARAHSQKERLSQRLFEELDDLYRANVRLPFTLTQALLPFLKLRSGQIVFINSSQGLEARATTGLFASTQHALKAFADSLRQEVNAEGIRVLSVYPGRTATARMKSLYKTEGRNTSRDAASSRRYRASGDGFASIAPYSRSNESRNSAPNQILLRIWQPRGLSRLIASRIPHSRHPRSTSS